MAPEQSAHSFDPRTWALIVACCSFILGMVNFWWTNRVRKDSEKRDKDIRDATVQREQFCEYLQRPISRVLDDLEAVGERLTTIASAGHIENEDDIIAINRDFTALHSRLRRNLRKADDSQFANGSDWDGLTSNAFDAAAEKLNAAYNPTLSNTTKCSSLNEVAAHIGEICAIVRGRLEAEISNQLP